MSRCCFWNNLHSTTFFLLMKNFISNSSMQEKISKSDWNITSFFYQHVMIKRKSLLIQYSNMIRNRKLANHLWLKFSIGQQTYPRPFRSTFWSHETCLYFYFRFETVSRRQNQTGLRLLLFVKMGGFLLI